MRERRINYAFYLASMADTVTILACDEVQALIDRALAGEFDDDLYSSDQNHVTVKSPVVADERNV